MTMQLSHITRSLIQRSPCREELVEFGDWLQRERYTDFVCGQHLRRLGYVISRLSPDGRLRAYSRADLERAFRPERHPRSRLFRSAGTRRAYERYLLSRGRLRLQPPHDRFVEVKRDYAKFVAELRGLSLSSRNQHAREVARFLRQALRPRQSLHSLTRSDVERYIELRAREISRHSLQHCIGFVRGFLRYIHCALDSLDAPKIYQGELPPHAIPWRSVQRLLASIDPRSKAGLRDLCMLHLIAYYGLRPCEVVDLRCDSVDWRANVLRVHQRKTRNDLMLALAERSTRLLRRYVAQGRDGRAAAVPELFLRARCPGGRLTSCAVSDAFEKRAREARLKLANGHHVYSLRHSFALRLLTRGVGIKAIGDVLGHRDLQSTRTYLRLDVHGLRDVALPVPTGRGAAGACHA
jgi:integrase/recombinase XerD